MATTNRTSNTITNATTVPKTANYPANGGPGSLKEVAGYVTPAADDSSTSVHRYCRVPSNARISQVLLSTGDATSAGAIDIGIYQTAENGGAVVDADLFASAVDLTGGPMKNLDVTEESGQYSVDELVKPLWEVLGLSTDPCREYDVAATITTTFNGGDTKCVIKVRYV
jgi:hypothetical protein